MKPNATVPPQGGWWDGETPDAHRLYLFFRLANVKLASAAFAQARTHAPQPETDDDGQPKPDPGIDVRMVEALKHDLAVRSFLTMADGFSVRDDGDALAAGKRIQRLYPSQAKLVGQVAEVVADLERRQKKGTFGKTPDEPLPKEFNSWNAERKLTYLIDSLDEVDARQFAMPGGIFLGDDPRVQALIDLGEMAVPRLIDTVEKDERLTRSAYYGRVWDPDRWVLGVREAALTALMTILQTRLHHDEDPQHTNAKRTFTSQGPEYAKIVAGRYRDYWAANGKLSIDERMMRVLADPKASHEAWREAADNLANLVYGRKILHTMGETWRSGSDGRPSSALAKFKNPTAAEAILAAMDRELDSVDADQSEIEAVYLPLLGTLRDPRIATEAVRRWIAAKTSWSVHHWAFVAHRSGDSGPITQLARELKQGKLKFPARRQSRISNNSPFRRAAANWAI